MLNDFILTYKNIFDDESMNTFKITYVDTSGEMKDLAKYAQTDITNTILQWRKKTDDTSGERTAIYNLDVETKILYKKIPNPDYIDEKDDKDPKDKDHKDPNDTALAVDVNSSRQKVKFLKIPKEIEVRTETNSVISELIRNDRKPFKYLYLEHATMERLKSYLHNFKEKRELYEKYGFPYKGGMLFYGVPGCGKTTAIVAIASHLTKPIYYIDLKGKTNKTLKMCIDYIGTTSQNGAIIVFEDIDCSTDVVLKREKQKTIDDKSEDKLTLSYLLNILDGSLSPENVIFVMTTNHPEVLDDALIRPGRVDITIEFRKCSRYQISNVYRDLYGEELDSKLIEQFPEYTYTTADVITYMFHNINNEISQEQLLRRFIDSTPK